MQNEIYLQDAVIEHVQFYAYDEVYLRCDLLIPIVEAL